MSRDNSKRRFQIQYGGHKERISSGLISENVRNILTYICAKFGACITKCTILLNIWAKPPHHNDLLCVVSKVIKYHTIHCVRTTCGQSCYLTEVEPTTFQLRLECPNHYVTCHLHVEAN